MVSRRQTIILALISSMMIIVSLYLASVYTYLLFHTLAELFSILVAGMVFVFAWNSRHFLSDGYLMFLGIALLFIGGIDLIHTLAYKGMNIFVGYDSDLPTQLWVAARYLQSISFLAAPLWIRRRLPVVPVFVGYTLLFAAILSLIFMRFFPVAYIEGVGLTPFKRISEYLISAILTISLIILFRNRKFLNRQLVNSMTLAILLSIASELTFTLYTDVYGLANFSGHILKILAFYFVYHAVVETGFSQPIQLLFTDLRRREIALEGVNRDLEEAVRLTRMRTEELEALSAELERSNQELEEFAFVASHDLQEPLRKIKLFGKQLEVRLEGKLDETEQSYLDRMENAAQRMQRMIDSLLLYARVNIQAQPSEQANLQEIADEVVSDLVFQINRTGGQVDIGELPVITADRLQMHQLLQNLIGNGLKFHKEGIPPEVKVHGEWRASSGPEDAEAPDFSRVKDAYFLLRVEDNGIGMEQKYLGRIFKPFERLHGRNEFEGSGMGLAICYKIVKRHNGTISVETEPGEGTTFTVSFPIRQEAS